MAFDIRGIMADYKLVLNRRLSRFYFGVARWGGVSDEMIVSRLTENMCAAYSAESVDERRLMREAVMEELKACGISLKSGRSHSAPTDGGCNGV